MMEMEKEAIRSLVEDAEEFKPLLLVGIAVLKSFGKEVVPIIDDLVNWVVDTNIRVIARYAAAGLTREHAVLLLLNSHAALGKALSKAATNQTPKKGK
jgi:hypothetical protein